MPTNPAMTGWGAALDFSNLRRVNGVDFPQTRAGIQAAIDSITDSSATKPYTVLLYPAIYDCTRTEGVSPTSKIGLDMTGTTQAHEDDPTNPPGQGGRDYIALAGTDRKTCILKRTTAAGTLTGLIQASAHAVFSKFRTESPVTRTIHWDTSGYLTCDAVDFISGGGDSAGVSTGIISTAADSSYHRITNCHFEGKQYSCHSNVDPANSLPNFIWITGNTFTASGTIIGLSLTSAGANSAFRIMISGNTQFYFNVDHGSGSIDLNMPTNAAAAAKVMIFTDGALRFGDSTAGGFGNNTYYYNAQIYPQNLQGYQVTGTAPIGTSGDLLIYDFATQLMRSASATGQNYPAVCINQADSTGSNAWFPRLATGPRAACFMATAGAVALGDQIVSASAARQGLVNNATGLDWRQIVGWAESIKNASATGLVTVRRNTMFGW